MFSLPPNARVNNGEVTRIDHPIGELIGSGGIYIGITARQLVLICRAAASSMAVGVLSEGPTRATR
jgi:hypothetical protein